MIPADQLLTAEQVFDLRQRYTILYETLQLVREYPDFDEGGPLADAIDSALRGEIPEILQFILEVRETYGPVNEGT
jgi:hypothetical protein